MKDFEVFSEETNNARTERIVKNLLPAIRNGDMNAQICAIASLEFGDFMHFLRALGGNIGPSGTVINLGSTGAHIYTLINEKESKDIMYFCAYLRNHLSAFFGDLATTGSVNLKNRYYPTFKSMLDCSSRKSWTKPESGFVYRGKATGISYLAKMGEWRTEGEYSVCKGSYTSQYPMQSWSYSRTKAELFADTRIGDISLWIDRLGEIGGIDKEAGGDWHKQVLKQTQPLGIQRGDLAVPVVIRCPVNPREFLFSADASDKIKVALKLFTKNTKERETVRVSSQPVAVEYMVKNVKGVDMKTAIAQWREANG
jgi:hypothetical protein